MSWRMKEEGGRNFRGRNFPSSFLLTIHFFHRWLMRAYRIVDGLVEILRTIPPGIVSRHGEICSHSSIVIEMLIIPISVSKFELGTRIEGVEDTKVGADAA